MRGNLKLAGERAIPALLLEEGGAAEHAQGHVSELQVMEAGDKPIIRLHFGSLLPTQV